MRILLFSLLSFFCISANAGWIKLNQNQAMDTAYFIDLENIKGTTEKVRIWTLTDYTNIQVTKKINYQSIKSFVEISPMEIITQAAQRQKFIDQSQSLNLMIPHNASPKEVSQLLIEGWQLKIKTFYYQRSSNPSQQLARSILNCTSCEA
mgnify:CR=1 FL=1